MPYSTIQLHQVLCKKRLGLEFSSEVNTSIPLSGLGEHLAITNGSKSGYPDSSGIQLPRDDSFCPGLWNKCQLKHPQRGTICPARLWVPSEGKCAKAAHVLLIRTRKTKCPGHKSQRRVIYTEREMLAGCPFPPPREKQETCNHADNEMNTLNSRSLEKISIKTYLLSQFIRMYAFAIPTR